MRTQPSNTKHKGRGIARLVAVITVVVLCVGGAFAFFAAGGEGEGQSQSADVARAQMTSFEITTLASGELEARNQVEIRSEVESATTIVEIVPEGTFVKRGDVLVRLNSDAIESDIAEEELAVEQAKSDLQAAEAAESIQVSENASSLRAAESALTLARLALDQWENGTLVKTKKSNDLAVEKAEKNLERLARKYEQSQKLFGEEFLSKDELDQDEIAWIDAKAALEQAKLDSEVYLTYQEKKDREQYQLDVKEAEDELDRVQKTNEINLLSKQSNTASRRRQLGLREERLAKDRTQLDACTIVAPSSGLVVYGTSTERNRWRAQNEGAMAVGRQVRKNDLIIVLPDTTEMIASVKVHESLAGRVRPGQPVSVVVDASSVTIPGVVDSIGVLAESGDWRDPNRREYTVRVALHPPEDVTLKPTMRCEARITLGRVDDALAVPVTAVFNDAQLRFVYVPDGPRYVKRPVMIGRRSATEVEILAGLEAGEAVLLREPRAGEISAEPWDEARLAAAGYTLDDKGDPAIDPERARELMGAAFAGQSPRGPRSGRGRPQPATDDQPASETGTKPDATDQTETGSTETEPTETKADSTPPAAPANGATTEPAGD